MWLPETTGRDRIRIAPQIVLLMLLPAFAFSSDFQTPAITAQELQARQQGADQPLVIDVRDRAEYKTGHVPGAINIPQKKLARQLDKLADASSVVLYCYNGKRTRLAEQTLIENDIPNVFHLDGGLTGWRQAGLKVRTGLK
jgi:hydroxyacylglutathione hydrolase